jgi:GMP synthase-like glutamine amidotransferase
MRILVVQNDDVSPLAYLDEPLEAYGADIPHVHPLRGERLPPDDENFDGLIVLGGDMHAENDENYPYLKDTVALILKFHHAEKPVLGICLGAQLIARAFGARVRRHEHSECGLFEIRQTAEGRADPLIGEFADPVHLIEYHDDYFEMPMDGVRVMESDTNPNQALRVGKTTYGFQMHLEASGELMERWLGITREKVEALDPGLIERFPVEMAVHGEAAHKFASDLGFGWLKMVKAKAARRNAYNASLSFDDYY